MKTLQVLMCCLILTVGTSCATYDVVEPPICSVEWPVLAPITVGEQLLIRNVDGSGKLLGKIASNQGLLISHAEFLEALIVAHDAPLGECDLLL